MTIIILPCNCFGSTLKLVPHCPPEMTHGAQDRLNSSIRGLPCPIGYAHTLNCFSTALALRSGELAVNSHGAPLLTRHHHQRCILHNCLAAFTEASMEKVSASVQSHLPSSGTCLPPSTLLAVHFSTKLKSQRCCPNYIAYQLIGG